MLGPYIKSRGSRGTEISANTDLITVETYVGPPPPYIQQGETIWKPVFLCTSQNVKKKVYFGLFGGPEGVFNAQTGPILLSSYSFIYIYVHVK